MNVLGLYDGCSCGQLSLKRIGINVDNYFASEIDKYAIQVTQKNFPDTIQLGNIYNIDYSELPQIDLILGGSPCTHWSIARKDRETTSEGIGFDLFMQYVKAVRTLKPKYFLYENNHSIHEDIKNAITKELGVDFIMINSSLVSAQQRKRCYWTNAPGIEQPQDKNIHLKDIVENGIVDSDKSYCIDASYYKGGNLKSYFEKHRRQLVFNDCLELGHATDINGHDFLKRIYSIYGKSPTLTAVCGGNQERKIALTDSLYRKLTPLECERLQTMDDNYTEGVSNSQRYKMIGNGWTIDVISHILRGML